VISGAHCVEEACVGWRPGKQGFCGFGHVLGLLGPFLSDDEQGVFLAFFAKSRSFHDRQRSASRIG